MISTALIHPIYSTMISTALLHPIYSTMIYTALIQLVCSYNDFYSLNTAGLQLQWFLQPYYSWSTATMISTALLHQVYSYNGFYSLVWIYTQSTTTKISFYMIV